MNEDGDFYTERGFSRLVGPGAEDVVSFWQEQASVRDRIVRPVGNLFEPVVTAEFVGAPCDLPINWLVLPERGMDYCLISIEPGFGFPEHVHGYGNELYLVVEGRGKVRLDGVLYDASRHDVFHIGPGVPHEVFNPKESTGPLRVFAVNTPAVRHDLRSTYWSHTTGRGRYGAER